MANRSYRDTKLQLWHPIPLTMGRQVSILTWSSNQAPPPRQPTLERHIASLWWMSARAGPEEWQNLFDDIFPACHKPGLHHARSFSSSFADQSDTARVCTRVLLLSRVVDFEVNSTEFSADPGMLSTYYVSISSEAG